MTPATGYYSLIQYCPDPSRLEAANVGVLLFSPTHLFLKARTAPDNRRVIRFFGREGHDWRRLNSFKEGLAERIEIEGPSIRRLADLESFIARRANRLQITPPRSMRVTDPEKDLEQLFCELVGGRSASEEAGNFRKYVARQFALAGLDRKLRKDIQVVVPAFGRRVEIPFGYQQKRFNLIHPARFQATEPEAVIPTACRYAVEGRSLYEHPDAELGELQLVVLGRFPSTDGESRRVVQQIFTENNVRLYSTNEMDRLIEEIRTTGKDLTGQPPLSRL
jgi:hypothetical protein